MTKLTLILLAITLTACGYDPLPDHTYNVQPSTALYLNSLGDSQPYVMSGDYPPVVKRGPHNTNEFPYRVWVNAASMGLEASNSANEAIRLINELAGTELLHKVFAGDKFDVIITYGDLPYGLGARTATIGKNIDAIVTNASQYADFRDLNLDVAVFTHEILHALSYISEDGKDHDNGVMNERIDEFVITPRHQAFLEYLARLKSYQ